MHVGLWRVGPLSKLCAALVLLSLFGYACASDGGPVKDSRSAATIIGGSGSTTTASDVAAPLDATTALSVGSDAATSSVTGSAEGSSTTAEGTEDTSSSAATTAAPDGSASSAPANEAGSTTTTATTGAGDPTTLPGTAAPSAPATTPVTTGSTGRNQVVGTGTPASCTSQAVVAAVAAGGTITFDCGPDPVTIPMAETAKVVNANGPEIVIDGGGLVTLSGQGQRRILYMNTCDQAQGWTTSHCQNQDHPRLTVQNLTFVSGNATGQSPDGGGAIFVRGGRLQVLNSTFDGNRCDDVGPDVGGAAIRVLSQYEGLPVTVSGSTFRNGVCSNGGAVSSIGVSWIISDTVMTDNRAIGRGANPAKAGTPGGGSGGAIYLDGNTFTVELRNTRIENNRANEGGGAVFFVSNDRTGRLSIIDSTLVANPSDQFETNGFPGIFFLGAEPPSVSNSTLSD